MTLISTGALDRALINLAPGNVGGLIQRMHRFVQSLLGQENEDGDSDDGLELGVCYLDGNRERITFAGARFELFIVQDGEVSQVKGTKAGIGYRGISQDQIYASVDIPVEGDMTFYLTSDGLVDQVGGERRRMFGKRRFRELLVDLGEMPLSDQKERILQALVDYQGGEVRRDDVSVIAFRV